MKKKRFLNAELLFFLAFSVVALLPFYLDRYVPSLDGPQHLYTGRLISELIRGDDLIKQFYRFNPVIVGNLSSQFILALLMFAFPAWLSEKVFLSACVIGLALSFRYFIKSQDRTVSLLYLLIFPFAFTSLFMLGYYNFSLAFIPFFFALGYIQKNEGGPGFRESLWLALLLLLIYLSHAVVFVFFGLIIFLQMIFDLGQKMISKSKEPEGWSIIVKKYLKILAAAIPAIVLWIRYYFHLNTITGFSTERSYKAVNDLLADLYKLKILTGFHQGMESGSNTLMFWILAALIFIAILMGFRVFRHYIPATNGNNLKKLKWTFISIVLFILAICLPDGLVTENMSSRLGILFFFGLITRISIQIYSRKIIMISLVMVFIAFTWHRVVVTQFYGKMNNEIVDLEEAGKLIKPRSIVFPVNCSENWLQMHFHCYLGVDKPLVDVWNPQTNGTMPVIWNYEKMPNIILGEIDQQQLGAHWVAGNKNLIPVPADYIFIWRSQRMDADEGVMTMVDRIKPYYTQIFRSDNGNAMLLGF